MVPENDPNTRAPVTPMGLAWRVIVQGLVGGAAAYAAGRGFQIDQGMQLAIVGVVMGFLAALGVHARNKGWFIGQLFVLPLVLVLAGGCASTPKKAWATALSGYQAAAVGMAIYCGNPALPPSDPCVKAAAASYQAEEIIKATESLIASDRASDAILEARTKELNDATKTVEGATP